MVTTRRGARTSWRGEPSSTGHADSEPDADDSEVEVDDDVQFPRQYRREALSPLIEAGRKKRKRDSDNPQNPQNPRRTKRVRTRQPAPSSSAKAASDDDDDDDVDLAAYTSINRFMPTARPTKKAKEKLTVVLRSTRQRSKQGSSGGIVEAASAPQVPKQPNRRVRNRATQRRAEEGDDGDGEDDGDESVASARYAIEASPELGSSPQKRRSKSKRPLDLSLRDLREQVDLWSDEEQEQERQVRGNGIRNDERRNEEEVEDQEGGEEEDAEEIDLEEEARQEDLRKALERDNQIREGKRRAEEAKFLKHHKDHIDWCRWLNARERMEPTPMQETLDTWKRLGPGSPPSGNKSPRVSRPALPVYRPFSQGEKMFLYDMLKRPGSGFSETTLHGCAETMNRSPDDVLKEADWLRHHFALAARRLGRPVPSWAQKRGLA